MPCLGLGVTPRVERAISAGTGCADQETLGVDARAAMSVGVGESRPRQRGGGLLDLAFALVRDHDSPTSSSSWPSRSITR
jgi:hypothetical protein